MQVTGPHQGCLASVQFGTQLSWLDKYSKQNNKAKQNRAKQQQVNLQNGGKYN